MFYYFTRRLVRGKIVYDIVITFKPLTFYVSVVILNGFSITYTNLTINKSNTLLYYIAFILW